MTLEPILLIIIFLCLFCGGGVSIFLILKFHSDKMVLKRLSMFTDYLAVLEYHASKAYDIIHKDRVLVYSLEAMRIPDEEFSAISHDFVNLIIKMIGPKLYDEFCNLYGTQQNFIFNLVEYFNTRYEEDEVRKQSLDDISNEKLEEIANDLPFGPNN